MGALKICPLRTPICIAKWRSPKRGRWGTLSLRAPARSGVRRPGFLRSEALRKGSPKTIIIFRQSHLLLWESTKAFGQARSKMGLVVRLERVRTSAHQGVQSGVANEALWHGGWPQSSGLSKPQRLIPPPFQAHIRRPYWALRSVTERTSSASFRSQHVVIGQ